MKYADITINVITFNQVSDAKFSPESVEHDSFTINGKSLNGKEILQKIKEVFNKDDEQKS